MTKRKMQKIVNRRPGPTTPDIVHIWSEWTDEFGFRRATCGEDCPVCGKTLRENYLLPPPKFRELDSLNMILCLNCGSRFEYEDYSRCQTITS